MHEIESIEEMKSLIGSRRFILFYLSRKDCGACGAVKPKLIKICEKYPGLELHHVDLDKNELIAGQYSIFTIPAVLVFADGKEAVREARNFSLIEIDQRIERLNKLIF